MVRDRRVKDDSKFLVCKTEQEMMHPLSWVVLELDQV